jgi:hypothetical protein
MPSNISKTDDQKVYEFHLGGNGKIVVVVTDRGAIASTSEGVKEQCRYCGDDNCEGDCDESREDAVENANGYFLEERRSDLDYNFAVDGIQAMVLQLCGHGLVNNENIDTCNTVLPTSLLSCRSWWLFLFGTFAKIKEIKMDRMEINNPLGDKPIAAHGNAALYITKVMSYESNRKAGKTPRIYMWAKDFNPIADIKGERWNKPFDLVRPHLKDILKVLKIDAPDATFKWDQKAGCKCGCSPGFIVRGAWFENDISLEYEVREIVPTKKEPAEAVA